MENRFTERKNQRKNKKLRITPSNEKSCDPHIPQSDLKSELISDGYKKDFSHFTKSSL